MTGTSDFNTQLAFTNSELIEGKFDFNARDGELLGLNLLDMAAQYLPINYNSDLTASRNMNTPYERFESNLSLENHLLKVDKISLKTTALLGKKMEKQLALIASSIKSIPDHPKPGIIFRDITSLVEEPAAFRAAID